MSHVEFGTKSKLANSAYVCVHCWDNCRLPAQQALICLIWTNVLRFLYKRSLLSDVGDVYSGPSLCFFHRYIADRWACCQAVVHHSCWIIHVLWRGGAERGRPYKAKLIKVVVLKVCLCLIQEVRKGRSAVIPFFSPCLYRSSPCLPPSLASLIPLFPWLSQENYNLTAHFNISASKWVWQPLLCVTLPFLCPYLHPSTHSSLSLPQPPCVVCLSLPSTGSTFSMWQERERERGRHGKNPPKKQIRLKPKALCQAIRLSLSVSWWVSWHVHDHEPTMRRGIASPW